MKLAMTTRERVTLAAIMARAPWGGTKQLLLAQGGIYEGLGLAKFVAGDFEKIASASSIDMTVYEIPDDAGPALVTMLSAHGQTAEMGLVAAGVLRRFDPVAAAAAAPSDGVAGTMSS